MGCRAASLTWRTGCWPAPRGLRQARSLVAESAKFATANPSCGGLADIELTARPRGLWFALMELFP